MAATRNKLVTPITHVCQSSMSLCLPYPLVALFGHLLPALLVAFAPATLVVLGAQLIKQIPLHLVLHWCILLVSVLP
jgi:hypothetical protein